MAWPPLAISGRVERTSIAGLLIQSGYRFSDLTTVQMYVNGHHQHYMRPIETYLLYTAGRLIRVRLVKVHIYMTSSNLFPTASMTTIEDNNTRIHDNSTPNNNCGSALFLTPQEPPSQPKIAGCHIFPTDLIDRPLTVSPPPSIRFPVSSIIIAPPSLWLVIPFSLFRVFLFPLPILLLLGSSRDHVRHGSP